MDDTSQPRAHFIAHSPPRRWIPPLALWLSRRRERRALAQLDPHLLRDIALTPAQQARESRKWPWST